MISFSQLYLFISLYNKNCPVGCWPAANARAPSQPPVFTSLQNSFKKSEKKITFSFLEAVVRGGYVQFASLVFCEWSCLCKSVREIIYISWKHLYFIKQITVNLFIECIWVYLLCFNLFCIVKKVHNTYYSCSKKALKFWRQVHCKAVVKVVKKTRFSLCKLQTLTATYYQIILAAFKVRNIHLVTFILDICGIIIYLVSLQNTIYTVLLSLLYYPCVYMYYGIPRIIITSCRYPT